MYTLVIGASMAVVQKLTAEPIKMSKTGTSARAPAKAFTHQIRSQNISKMPLRMMKKVHRTNSMNRLQIYTVMTIVTENH